MDHTIDHYERESKLAKAFFLCQGQIDAQRVPPSQPPLTFDVPHFDVIKVAHGRRIRGAWRQRRFVFVGTFTQWNSTVFAQPYVERPLRASDLCRDRLMKLVQIVERFPSSYNKILVQGVADYCARVLVELNENDAAHRPLFSQVRTLTKQLVALCDQYRKEYPGSFWRLDLQMIEDRFELVQVEAARLGVLPRLSDMPTRELVQR